LQLRCSCYIFVVDQLNLVKSNMLLPAIELMMFLQTLGNCSYSFTAVIRNYLLNFVRKLYGGKWKCIVWCIVKASNVAVLDV